MEENSQRYHKYDNVVISLIQVSELIAELGIHMVTLKKVFTIKIKKYTHRLY